MLPRLGWSIPRALVSQGLVKGHASRTLPAHTASSGSARQASTLETIDRGLKSRPLKGIFPRRFLDIATRDVTLASFPLVRTALPEPLSRRELRGRVDL